MTCVLGSWCIHSRALLTVVPVTEDELDGGSVAPAEPTGASLSASAFTIVMPHSFLTTAVNITDNTSALHETQNPQRLSRML